MTIAGTVDEREAWTGARSGVPGALTPVRVEPDVQARPDATGG